MRRINVETSLNESRSWLLGTFEGLTDDQSRRPLTTSEHNPSNVTSCGWSVANGRATRVPSHTPTMEVKFERASRS
ncbi:MAG: hypothetical protein ACYDB2_08165 [Acidimicrobiales bacterium]